MDVLMVQVRMIGPRDRATYGRMRDGRYVDMGVGVHAQVFIEGNVMVEGAVDPDRLDAFVIAVERMTEGMDVFFRDNRSNGPDVTREGWGQRWLERAVYRLREAVRSSLSDAVDALAERHDQLRRLK